MGRKSCLEKRHALWNTASRLGLQESMGNPLLRPAEWINLVFFLSIIGIVVVLHRGRVRGALAFGAAGVFATLGGTFSAALLPYDWSAMLRDWLPVPLVPLAYQQAGSLYTRPNLKLQNRLQRIDDFFARRFRALAPVVRSLHVTRYLEGAYLLAYPLVPLGLASLCFSDLDVPADDFWSVVLPSTYLCYVMLPFAPTLPPRLNGGSGSDLFFAGPRARTEGRRMNVWILDRLGIGANTFPSGHVAATTAASLVVLEHRPILGAVFLWVSASIAVSVVIRRYHYLTDAVLAVAMVLVVWWAVG